MKKTVAIVLIIISITSCKFTGNDSDSKVPKDPSEEVVLGGDKDANGCLASAGYTWSKLNKECVKAFAGMQLLPADDLKSDDVTMCTYVLFDESTENAELFLPSQDESVLLKREAKDKPWTNGDYQLVSNKGFQLYKGGKLIYAGDGGIGNQISGSNDSSEDNSEE